MKFRQKPIVIEAMEFNGENGMEIEEWAHKGLPPEFNAIIRPKPDDKFIEIRTLEGTLYATRGDFIIKGVKGEFYPCKPDIFKATYDRVDEEPLPCGAGSV